MSREMQEEVTEFNADPGEFLARADDAKRDPLAVAKILNAASFYCRWLDTNRWTAQQVRRLFWNRDNPDLCSELAALKQQKDAK